MPNCEGFREGDIIKEFETGRIITIAYYERGRVYDRDWYSPTHFRVIRLASEEEHLAMLEALKGEDK